MVWKVIMILKVFSDYLANVFNHLKNQGHFICRLSSIICLDFFWRAGLILPLKLSHFISILAFCYVNSQNLISYQCSRSKVMAIPLCFFFGFVDIVTSFRQELDCEESISRKFKK